MTNFNESSDYDVYRVIKNNASRATDVLSSGENIHTNGGGTRKKYRIKSKFRFITSLVIMLGLVIGICGAVTGLSHAIALTKPVYQEVQISDGDTIWNIAREYKNEDTDIRQAVYEICKVNDIDASDLYPGMIISVPEDL